MSHAIAIPEKSRAGIFRLIPIGKDGFGVASVNFIGIYELVITRSIAH